MVSNRKLKEIMAFFIDNGEASTVKRYNLKPSTLERYMRLDRFEETKVPKILLLDIETSPMKVLAWGLWKQTIQPDAIIQSWNIISWAAKWLFSPDIYNGLLTPKEAKKGDDKRIMLGIWQLMEDADIICGHNLDKFDIKRIKTRFILNGIKPPLPFQTVDTLKVLRKEFALPSNRLDYVGKLVRNKGKIATNLSLWIRCMNGDADALDEMSRYNNEDVFLLEEVYLFIRPWIKSHPNLGLYIDAKDSVCENCGSNKLTWGGAYATMVNKYAAFRCECGAIGRCRESMLSKEQRKELVASTAR